MIISCHRFEFALSAAKFYSQERCTDVPALLWSISYAKNVERNI